MIGDTPLNHQARKRFGQNFLVDSNIIEKIVNAIAIKPSDKLIEIGPGKGALTGPLLQQCPSLTAIELDRDLAAHLRQWQEKYPHFNLIEKDVLNVDFAQLAQQQPVRIVGNLPYNISTPLIFHLLGYRHLIQDMHFMLQKEVVERLNANPNTKAYGRLSIMVQYSAKVDYLFTVEPSCFSPPPKVTSAIVRLTPFKQLAFPASDEKLFATVVATCFQMRRKTLRNCLRKLCSDDIINALPIDLGARPEDLSVQDFVELSNAIALHRGTEA